MGKIIFCDFDGTLYNNHEISINNINCISKFQKEGGIFVIATGRSVFSLKKNLPVSVLPDYVIFSSGAGIINWKNDEILYCNHFNYHVSENIKRKLIELNLNFMVHFPIPDNHKFYL